MGGQNNVRQFGQRMLGRQRFCIEHVQAGARNRLAGKSMTQSGLFDDRTACRVDEVSGRPREFELSGGERGTSEELAGPRCLADLERKILGAALSG